MLISEQHFSQTIKAKYIHICIYVDACITYLKNNPNANLNEFYEDYYTKILL